MHEPADNQSTPTASDEWTGAVERLGWGGIGVGRLADGKVLLLHAAQALFPGEQVRARVALQAKHAEGEVTAWLAPDARRVEPACPVAERCGGCSLWGAGEHEPELVRLMLTDLLRRQLPDAPAWDYLPAPAGTRRQRIQLHWDGQQLGFHARRSHTLVPVQACPLAVPEVSAAIPVLAQALAQGPLPATPARWELATGTPAGDVWATANIERNNVYALISDSELQLQAELPYVLHNSAGRELRHAAGGFFQVCPAWAGQAFSSVFNAWELHGGKLFDCYGGVGFCSALLAGRFERYIVVDGDATAIACARKNLQGLAYEAHHADVETWLGRRLARDGGLDVRDVLLFDPPRTGLPRNLPGLLERTPVQQMVLIGCDGAVFCRDVRRLAPQWRLEQLSIAGLFPNTPLAEFIGLLRRVA